MTETLYLYCKKHEPKFYTDVKTVIDDRTYKDSCGNIFKDGICKKSHIYEIDKEYYEIVTDFIRGSKPLKTFNKTIISSYLDIGIDCYNCKFYNSHLSFQKKDDNGYFELFIKNKVFELGGWFCGKLLKPKAIKTLKHEIQILQELLEEVEND